MTLSQDMRFILDDAISGTLKPDAAVAELVTLGMDKTEAEEFVLIALGGSDIVETDENGQEVYVSADGSEGVPVGPDGWPMRSASDAKAMKAT